jgi:rhamnogalacturonan endolyase
VLVDSLRTELDKRQGDQRVGGCDGDEGRSRASSLGQWPRVYLAVHAGLGRGTRHPWAILICKPEPGNASYGWMRKRGQVMLNHAHLRFWWVILGVCMATEPLSSAPIEPVTTSMTDDVISIQNGLIALDIARKDGIIATIKKFDGHVYHDLGVTAKKAAYVAPSDSERNDPSVAMYWDANGGADVIPPRLKQEVKGYYRLRPGQAKTDLIVNTADRAEVSITAPPAPLFPFSIETHYVIFRGQSGFYTYVVLHHDKNCLASTLYHTRFVIKTVMDGTFDQWAVGDGKFVLIPQAAVTKKLTDATWQLADGTVKSKYMNSVYWAQVPVYGYVGKDLGLWMIEPSPEYHNGGPTKQGQTVHDNVLLRVLQSVHFGASPVKLQAGEEWSKVYGPFFVYTNQKPGAAALWQDAEEELAKQRSAWPYSWVTSSQYQHERGTVTGLVIIKGHPVTHATAILAPGGTDWNAQSKGYNYWDEIGSDGSFHISHVVPGNYSLFVTGADQPKDFIRSSIEVKANQTNDQGVIDWVPVTHGEKIFQIGVFDRSAGEFRNGDKAREFGMFRRYSQQFPHDVRYIVGQSHPAEDWNYAHWTLYNEKPAWSIIFRTHTTHGQATLTIGIASAQPAHGNLTDLRVRINGQQIGRLQLPKTGTAGYRGGTQDSPYHLEEITFPAALLREGENTIELEHADAQLAHQFLSQDANSDTPASGSPGQIMYDAIRLEVQPDAAAAHSRLIGTDDFKHGLSQWRIESEKPATVTAHDGVLEIDAPAGLTLWWKQKLHGPIAIEYLATVMQDGGVNDRVSDLNCFWMATDPTNPQDFFAKLRHGAFPEYNALRTYYVGLGGNDNTTTRFRRYIGDAKERPLLSENDLTDADNLLIPNHQQSIQLIADGGTVAYERDGKRLFTYQDDHPYEEGWFGLRTAHSHIVFRNLLIFQLQDK